MWRGVAIVLGVVAILIGGGAGYLVGNSSGRTLTSVSTTTTTIIQSFPPFSYLTTAFGCTLSVSSHTPCIGSPAYVFNSCLKNQSMPATPSTCAYSLKGPPYSTYSFNITLGVRGQSGEPEWADCSVSGGIGYADCISVINSTAFIVAVAAPPPQ